MVTTARLKGLEVDTEVNLTDNEYVDVDDEFQDIFVDRRSLNMFQSSPVEGKTVRISPYGLFLYNNINCRVLAGSVVCKRAAIQILLSAPHSSFSRPTPTWWDSEIIIYQT